MDVSLSSIVPYCLAVPGSGPSSNSGACISAMELCVRYLCGYGDMQCKWAEVRIVYFPIQGKCNIIDAHTYLRKKKTQLTPYVLINEHRTSVAEVTKLNVLGLRSIWSVHAATYNCSVARSEAMEYARPF